MIAAMILGCGGITTEHGRGAVGSASSSPSPSASVSASLVLPPSPPTFAVPPRPAFTALPVDFRKQCPPTGCTLALPVPALSGEWSLCSDELVTSFDPTTYDFAPACSGVPNVYATPPRPTLENSVYFIDHGNEYQWFDTCIAQNTMLGPNGELLTPACWAGGSDDRLLEFHAEGQFLHRASDGNQYLYAVEGATDPRRIYQELLSPADTATMATECSRVDTYLQGFCGGAGLAFPFGPSGVGPAPTETLARSWLICGKFFLHGALPSDNDVEGLCPHTAALLEGPGWDTAYWNEFYRFNADGTLDDIWIDYPGTTCKTATVGATTTELHFFFCSMEPASLPQSPLGTGTIGTSVTPYEIRSIAGNDYLIWQTHDQGYAVYQVAMAQPLETDPCAGTALPACVLGGGAP